MSKKRSTYIKIFFIVLVFLFIGIPTTGSYFINKELSSRNELASTVLDIELAPEANFDPDEDISSGDTQSRDFIVHNLGDDGFPYKIRLENITGDPDLCSALQADLIFHDGPGSSGAMSLDTLEFSVAAIEGDESFTLEITLPSDETDPNLGSSACTFALAADMWTDNLSPGQAYFDTEKFSNQITTGSFNGLQELQDIPESTESEQ